MQSLFLPCRDILKESCARYFDYLGGIKTLVKIHREIKSMDFCGKFLPLFEDDYMCWERICCSCITEVVVLDE